MLKVRRIIDDLINMLDFRHKSEVAVSDILSSICNILLNKSLARILISYPGLNEYEIFYLVLINKYGDLKINVFS